MDRNDQPIENPQDRQDNGEYVYVGKKPKTIPLYAAICAIIICIVMSVLATFALCTILDSPYDGNKDGSGKGELSTEQNGTEGEGQQNGGNINTDGLDVPSYFKDVIVLDEVFKQYSFDGIDEEKMQEAILDAYIAATGDIYAEYLNAEEYEAYFTERKGEFVGVGVSIVNSEITVNGYTYKVMEIISVFKDSPALESGVKVGDCIMYVDNGGELTLVDEMGYTQALDVMLGEAGTLANFVVFRPQGSDWEEIEFSIARRKVETQSVYYRVSETNSKVGIINITGFDMTTPPQFKNAVDSLKESGCEYFVFDVRNNPGGALDSIETVLTYFLNEGDEIVSTEYSTGETETQYARVKRYSSEYSGFNVAKEEIGMYKDLNCIVITNENTASAAELFTATLRDYGLAKVVGGTTYGKGCMQTLFPLSYYGLEGGLKLTVAMYYSQSKTVYHGIGIEPDYKVALSDEALEYNFFLLPEEKDDQMLKAIEELVK